MSPHPFLSFAERWARHVPWYFWFRVRLAVICLCESYCVRHSVCANRRLIEAAHPSHPSVDEGCVQAYIHFSPLCVSCRVVSCQDSTSWHILVVLCAHINVCAWGAFMAGAFHVIFQSIKFKSLGLGNKALQSHVCVLYILYILYMHMCIAVWKEHITSGGLFSLSSSWLQSFVTKRWWHLEGWYIMYTYLVRVYNIHKHKQINTAQYSTAQHSTAQHSIMLYTTNALHHVTSRHMTWHDVQWLV